MQVGAADAVDSDGATPLPKSVSGTRTHPATVAMQDELCAQAREMVKTVLSAVLEGQIQIWSKEVIEVRTLTTDPMGVLIVLLDRSFLLPWHFTMRIHGTSPHCLYYFVCHHLRSRYLKQFLHRFRSHFPNYPHQDIIHSRLRHHKLLHTLPFHQVHLLNLLICPSWAFVHM